jgi:hypothetical protein
MLNIAIQQAFHLRFAHRLAVALLALTALGGCQAYPHYVYQPRPATQSLEVDGQPVRVLASVLGVREPGHDQQPYLDVRLRLDNDSDHEARLDPATLSAVSADLQRLDVLSTQPAEALIVAPGAVGLLQARFALPVKPDDGPDLSGVSLRWAVQVGEQRFSRDMAFRGLRYVSRPYDPWYDDDWYYGPSWRRGWRYHSGFYMGF